MKPSSGRRKVLNAAATRAGLAIQTMSRARRGKRPPSSANRQPILLTSCLVVHCPRRGGSPGASPSGFAVRSSRLLPLCITPLEHKPRRGGWSSPKDTYPLGEFHRCRSMGTRWYVESPGAGTSTSSSFPLPQTEGEHDQSQADHHREGTDQRRQKRHICTGQDCKEYAKQHRQGAASGQ